MAILSREQAAFPTGSYVFSGGCLGPTPLLSAVPRSFDVA